MTTWNVKVAKTVCLGAASYLVLSAVSGAVFAQTASGTQTSPAPGNTTTLSPVIVQSNTARPARKRTAQSATRARSQNAANANRGRGTGQDQAAAGSGQRPAETARGHVDGYVANRSATGTKTDTPLIETPAAISVITQDQIQAQAAQSIPQAVRYTSGVRAEQTGSDARFNSISIRGFTADQYLDGMKLFTSGFSASIVDPFNLERIEVLHGPASILYGQGSPGGVIDMVSKRPTVDPYHEVFVSTGSYGRVQGGVDVSGPIDQQKEWLYRLTASGFDVGTQVDHTSYQRVSIAPSLTWRPDTDTTITFLGTYQNDPKAGFYNLLPRTGVLFPYGNGSRIPTSFYNGDPNLDRMSRELGQVGYLAEHRFNNTWTVRQNLRYTDLSSDITTVYYTGATTTPTVPRSAFFEGDRLKTFQIDNQAEGKFYTGPFQHTLLFGVDYQKGSFGTTAGGPTSAVPSQNVFNPLYGLSLPMVPTSKSFQDFNQVGLYTQDQIKIDRWVALLGVRWDQAETNTQGYSGATKTVTLTPRSDEATSKRFALLYKFDNGLAPYIQYTESFQPTVTNSDYLGRPFKPTTGQQSEVGVKYQPDPKSLYTLALFNLTQQNVLTPDTDSTHTTIKPGAQVQTGEVRSRGLELEAKKDIGRSLSLIASYTYLENTVTKSNTAIQVGRQMVGMPTNSAALWADYTFRGGALDGFGLAGGVRYIGDTAANISGTTVYRVPDVTLFDAAIHYDFGALGPQYKGYQLQVNATNLFDKTYVNYCQDNGCWWGLRREVIATLRYKW